MRGAVLLIAAAALLSACTTTTPERTAAVAGPRTDYSRLSCREIAAELALTERAFMSTTRRQRSTREGETAQAYLFPASLGAAPPVASAKLEARLNDLRRASRAKRCSSAWRTYDTATA
jgi:hypothetical protein